MLIAALSVIAPTWKPSKHTSTVDGINELQPVDTIESYRAMRTNTLQLHTAMMDESHEHYSERSQTQNGASCVTVFMQKQNEALLLEIRNLGGGQRGLPGRGQEGTSANLAMFCFLMWVLVKQVFSVLKFYQAYTYTCTFLYVFYFLLKS